MKYEGNEKLIVYVITFGPKSTRSLLGDTSNVKDSTPSPKIKEKTALGKYTTSKGEGVHILMPLKIILKFPE